jgi:hypothetical protein
MKINKILTKIAIYFLIFFPQIIYPSFKNDSDEYADADFITKMHEIEERIQKSFNQFHDHFFHDVDAYTQDLKKHSENILNQSMQPNLEQSQNGLNFYQQSTSSLSFSNQDKAIKITEQKNSTTTIYTIHVTDKKFADDENQESMEEINNLAELQALQTYIKNNFHAKQAVSILEECINTISHEQKNKVVNIESSTDGNQKKYTIEISQKKDGIDTKPEDEKIEQKNKKRQASISPRHKTQKNSINK